MNNEMMKKEMEVGSFLSFADFFFDGFVADYLVQSKISDAIYKVEQIMNELKKRM